MREEGGGGFGGAAMICGAPRRRGSSPELSLSDLSLTILPEQAEDDPAIEKLYERTFGPGRFARTAYRLREIAEHRRELSFTARIGTLLVGSVRLTPIRIGEAAALLLGPLTVEPPFREHGIGAALIEASLAAAKKAGSRLVLLVGDEPYYGRLGFKKIPRGLVKLPGPVDPERVLVAELADGAFAKVSGPVRPDWAKKPL
jgi:predicted N-acetyltransferase YhbS